MPYRGSFISYWVVCGLAGALIVLAVLQYRWSEQVSDAEREHIKSSLQISVAQFRQEFARDLIALASGLQIDPGVTRDQDWNRLGKDCAEWLRTNSNAALAGAVYVWKPDGSWLQFDRAKDTFEPASAPPAMSSLAEHFQRAADNGPGRFRNMGLTVDTRVPALVRPLVAMSSMQPGWPPEPPHVAGYFVIELDRDYLRQTILPQLASSHFSGANGLVYQVAVVTGAGVENPLYQSSPLTAESIASADLVVNLVDPRPRNSGKQGHAGPPPDNGFVGGVPGPGPGAWAARDARGPRPNFDKQRDPHRFQTAMIGMILSTSDSPAWRLIVRHRAGSVEAAVQAPRRRNLAISFAILLLLGASMAMIVTSTQRAHRLARLQMDFVAGVSHELRTPLTVISSAAQNLSDGIIDGKPQVRMYGSLIRNESRRLAEMMDQVLQFAAAGGKRRAYEPVPLVVRDVVENALAGASAAVQEAGVTVEKEIAPNLPCVLGESGGLTQCLQNLIANAVKYGGDARWMRIRARASDDAVRISVEDRGIGIEAADLPYIFDAFYRSQAAAGAQIHGTGLGLSLARSFAQEAGGSITVESTPGEGTTFTLVLPAARLPLLEPETLTEHSA